MPRRAATVRSTVRATVATTLATVVALGSAVLVATLGSAVLVAATPAAAGPAPVRVVAAENFWGDIAAQIGGPDVAVTSLITNPNADPHLFETDAREAATLAEAQVVIENGAGYDTWMGSLLGADGGNPTVVDAATVLKVSGSDPNPHLWYDIARVPQVAAAIAAALRHAAPQDAATFAHRLHAFDVSLLALDAAIGAIKAHDAGTPVGYTERVPGYLLAQAGLVVKTPPGFAKAIEDGTIPGAADTVAMRDLLSGRTIRVPLYNTQTVTPVTTEIRALARQYGIPVVGVSETMPVHDTYQQWQRSQLAAAGARPRAESALVAARRSSSSRVPA